MPKQRKYPWYAARECYRKQVTLPDKTVRTLYAKTEEEMDAKLAELRLQIEANAIARSNPTVGQYAIEWFNLNTGGLSPARVADYRLAINNYIAPELATKRVREVTLADGKKLLAGMAGKSASLQANVVCVLRRMFDDAEEDGLIIRSPFRRLKAGGKKAQEKQPLTDAQAEALIQAVTGTPAEPFVMLGLFAGLRKEEILGLRWCNVHLEPPAYVDVRERVVHVKNQPVHEAELKSAASRRKVPIPDILVNCLKRQERIGEFVIHSKDGGPRSSASFKRLWQIVTNRMIREGEEHGDKVQNHKVYKTLDFKVTPHLLRHTYITNLCRSGLNVKVIQYLAGHATAQLTLNIYIHATENQPADLTEQINAAFGTPKKIQKQIQAPEEGREAL